MVAQLEQALNSLGLDEEPEPEPVAEEF